MTRQMSPKLIKDYRDQSWAYDNFAPEGRLHIVCPQCRALVLLFEDLPNAQKREIAELVHSGKSGEGMDLLERLTDCGPRQAKANILHVSRIGPRCRNCEKDLPRGALLCSQCMSVNLYW